MIRITIDINADEEDGAIKIQPELTMTTFAPNDHEKIIADRIHNSIMKAFADIYYELGAVTEYMSKRILEQMGVYDILNKQNNQHDDEAET